MSEKRDTIPTQYVKLYHDLTEFYENIEKFKQNFPVDELDTEKEIVLPSSYFTEDPSKEVVIEREPRVPPVTPPTPVKAPKQKSTTERELEKSW